MLELAGAVELELDPLPVPCGVWLFEAGFGVLWLDVFEFDCEFEPLCDCPAGMLLPFDFWFELLPFCVLELFEFDPPTTPEAGVDVLFCVEVEEEDEEAGVVLFEVFDIVIIV